MTTRAGHDPGGKWELIGPSECPVFWRRTLFACRFGKLLVHRFAPLGKDKDPHDHPSSFVTVVLRGGYLDVDPCECDGDEHDRLRCSASVVDAVAAPTVRFRRAEHTHLTYVGSQGATTVVWMFPKRRDWGFRRHGRWYEWREYELRFGLDWRCDE